MRLFLEHKARVQPLSLARPVGQLAYTRVVQLLGHVAAGEDTAENMFAVRQTYCDVEGGILLQEEDAHREEEEVRGGYLQGTDVPFQEPPLVGVGGHAVAGATWPFVHSVILSPTLSMPFPTVPRAEKSSRSPRIVALPHLLPACSLLSSASYATMSTASCSHFVVSQATRYTDSVNRSFSYN